MLVWHLKGSKLTRRQILTAQQDIWHDIPLLTSWVGNTCQSLPRQDFVRDRWEPVGASGKLRSGQEIGEEAEKGKKNLRQIEALSFPINVQVTKYTCAKSEVSNTFSRLWHHICLLIENIFDTLDMNSMLQMGLDQIWRKFATILVNVHQVWASMSWMRLLFALLLPLCGDGSYNNYRLSMLADEPFVVDSEGDDDEDGSEDVTKWEWRFHAALTLLYASTQLPTTWASLSSKIHPSYPLLFPILGSICFRRWFDIFRWLRWNERYLNEFQIFDIQTGSIFQILIDFSSVSEIQRRK